jgi:Restriction endonuclease
MSSFDRGNNFEVRVHKALEEELASGRLLFFPENCLLHRKKGYYSKDRDSKIVVDISIEVWRADAEHWSILLVCECKDYSGAVPVSDIEEFKAKLDQIAGKNIKGMFAVRGAIQSNALTYAKAHGIAVIRMLSPTQVTWLLNGSHGDTVSSAVASRVFDDALTYSEFEAVNQSIFGTMSGHLFSTWHDFLHFSLRVPTS